MTETPHVVVTIYNAPEAASDAISGKDVNAIRGYQMVNTEFVRLSKFWENRNSIIRNCGSKGRQKR